MLVAGWLLLIANVGQGANDVWAVGHLVLFVANALWVPAILLLRDEAGLLAPRLPWRVAIALVVAGSVAIAGQLAIDLAAWALTTDQSSLTTFFQTMRSRALLVALFYVGGPPLLFLGLAIGSIALGRSREPYRAGTRIVAAGLIVVLLGAVATFSYVILAGYVVALIGFLEIARRMTSANASAVAPAAV